MSHHGDPAEEELIVVEEPETTREEGPKKMRAPRVPPQKRLRPTKRHTYHMRSGVRPAWQAGAETNPADSASPEG